jgi:hypothetical protein
MKQSLFPTVDKEAVLHNFVKPQTAPAELAFIITTNEQIFVR